jgi:hypothetical protein
MSEIDQIITVLDTRALSDVIVAGSLKAGGRAKRFKPSLTAVYLDFKGTLIRCSSVNQYSALEMRLVDEIDLTFDIMEGDERCVAPVSALCLRVPGWDHNIRSLRVLVEPGIGPEAAIFACAGIGVGESDYLFFDPMSISGIRLGEEADEIVWERDRVAPEQGWDELVWLKGQGDRALRRSAR